jgi:hypothetical protein
MDEHVDVEKGVDRRECVADAQPWRLTAAWAACGTGEDDTAAHA